MAKEMVMLAKEKYDSLMKSCQATKNNDNQQDINKETQDLHCNGVSNDNVADSELNVPMFCDILQYTIPEKMQNKANGLIRYLHQHGSSAIKWSPRGQIIINGEVIQGSHIVDLSRDAVCPKTVHPANKKRFCNVSVLLYEGLVKPNVVKTLFKRLTSVHQWYCWNQR